MLTHSLIVCALLSFSLTVQADVASVEGSSTEARIETTATMDAILHRDVGLQQGGGVSKDVTEVHTTLSDCSPQGKCLNAGIEPHGPRAQTLNDLLILNKDAADPSFLIFILLVIIASVIYATRRAPSTK